MGIAKGGSMLAKAKNIVARELDSVLREVVFKSATNEAEIVDRQFRIDCDISNILHLLAFNHSRIFSTALVRDVALFLKNLAADTGYVVTAVLDGDIRPQSKRDAFKRRYVSTMNRINGYFCRQAAMKIASSKPKDELTNEEKTKLNQYNNQSKKLESSYRLDVPSDLKDQLESALLEVHAFSRDRQSGGYVSNIIIKAEFESDYMIAYRIRNNLSDIVYSTDSDMSVLCGPRTILIRSFRDPKKKKRQQKEKDKDEEASMKVYEIAVGSNTLMNEIKAHINTNFPMLREGDAIEYEEAKYPIFESNPPPLMAGLYVVGIGCDVLPGGISGVTPLGIMNELQTLRDNGVRDDEYGKIYRHFISFYLKKDKTKKLSELDIRTYVQAFLYQPALEFRREDDAISDPNAYKYIFHKPATLSPYLKMFAHPTESGITIEDDEQNISALQKCNGAHGINLPHEFLRSEGCFTCSSCQACFCNTCRYSPTKDRDGKTKAKNPLVHYEHMNDDLCLECYKQSIFLPHSVSLEDALTVDEMRSYLQENNQPLANDASAHEVQEIYEMCKEEQRNNTNNSTDDAPYPIYPSSSLYMENNRYKFGQLVDTFDIKNGGFFINSPKITNGMIAPILKLFANIVRYSDDKKKYTDFDSPIYDVIPTLFVEFANGSRAGTGTGFHLLKRCLRHSLDPRSFPLTERRASLFVNEKDGEMGLVLSNKVGASMKEADYETMIAFTSNDIIATKCQCRAGGECNERVVCVHNLPVLYQLVMLLDDGLSEHLLVELCSKWNTDIEECVEKDGKTVEVRTNIEILMLQDGRREEDINAAKAKPTIAEMLAFVYATGTQRSKRIPSPPDVKKLRPFRDIDLSSVVKKAKKRKESNETLHVDNAHRNNNTLLPDILRKDPNGQTLVPLPCDFCNSGICTTHVCRHPEGNKRIEGESDNICGLASCVLCCGENEENRTRCKNHRNGNNDNTATHNNVDNDEDIPLLPPDYYDMYCSIKALGFNVEKCEYPGFRLLMHRVADILEAKGQSKVSGFIKNRRKRWITDFSASYKRVRPTYEKQKHTVKVAPPPTTNQTCVIIGDDTPPVSAPKLPAVPKKNWRRGPHRKCCFVKCNNNERTDTNMQRVVDLPKKKPDYAKDRMRDVRRYIKKYMQRKYTLKACAKKDEGGIYFICSAHDMQELTKTMNIKRNNTETTIKHSITVPTGTGVKSASPPVRQSKGLGSERAFNRMVSNMKEDIAGLDTTKTNKYDKLVDAAQDNAAMVLLSFRMNDELEEKNKKLEEENEELKKRKRETGYYQSGYQK